MSVKFPQRDSACPMCGSPVVREVCGVSTWIKILLILIIAVLVAIGMVVYFGDWGGG